MIDLDPREIWLGHKPVCYVRADLYDALREAAGRVTCQMCEGNGSWITVAEALTRREEITVPCPDCADLRRLLALGSPSDQPEDAG